MRVHVAFTPAEAVSAPVGIVVDVLRATSTIVQALAAGYRRVLCCTEVEEARAAAADEGPAVLGGERLAVRIPGFDFGNSPREFAAGDPRATLVLTTTNGTRLLMAASARCDEVLVASLLNLDAVVAAARGADEVAVLCAGVEGAFAIDDAYVAGRLVADLGGQPDDAAIAAMQLAASFASAADGIGGGVSADNIRRAGLEEDIRWCARESVLDAVPRFTGRIETAAEIRLDNP